MKKINEKELLDKLKNKSAEQLVNIIVDTIEYEEKGEFSWKGRTIFFLNVILKPLVWKRDHQNAELTIELLKKYSDVMEVKKLEDDESLPEEYRKNIKEYLEIIPSYDSNKDHFNEAYYYLQMCIMRFFIILKEKGFVLEK